MEPFATTAHAARRLDRARSLLLVVDVQQRLVPRIAQADAVVRRIVALLAAASRFDVPRIATLHCADRIGGLVEPIDAVVTDDERIAKTRFCAADEPAFLAKLARAARTQIVIAGMEGHVCVLQTALGLVDAHYEVFVVADAVGSRTNRTQDRELALSRMRDAGITLVGTEMALFEWTGDAEDAAFRDMLAIVKQLPDG